MSKLDPTRAVLEYGLLCSYVGASSYKETIDEEFCKVARKPVMDQVSLLLMHYPQDPNLLLIAEMLIHHFCERMDFAQWSRIAKLGQHFAHNIIEPTFPQHLRN